MAQSQGMKYLAIAALGLLIMACNQIKLPVEPTPDPNECGPCSVCPSKTPTK